MQEDSDIVVTTSGGATFEGMDAKNVSGYIKEYNSRDVELNPEIEKLIRPAIEKGYAYDDRNALLLNEQRKGKPPRHVRAVDDIIIDLDVKKREYEAQDTADTNATDDATDNDTNATDDELVVSSNTAEGGRANLLFHTFGGDEIEDECENVDVGDYFDW